MFCFDKACPPSAWRRTNRAVSAAQAALTWERGLVSTTHTSVCRARIRIQMARRPATHRHQLHTP